MSLKPLNDRVLVKRLESEERTASGLYIPDTAKEKPSKGEVVAVGPGKHADDGKLGCEGGRHGPLQQVCRHRSQDRRRRASRHA